MKKHKNLKSLPSELRPDELPAAVPLRNFARMLLPIYELEFQQQLSSPQPCWRFLAVLEHQMRVRGNRISRWATRRFFAN